MRVEAINLREYGNKCNLVNHYYLCHYGSVSRDVQCGRTLCGFLPTVFTAACLFNLATHSQNCLPSRSAVSLDSN